MPLRKPLQTMSNAEFRRWVERWWPEVSKLNPLGFGLPFVFGDGSDGDVDFTTASFVTGTIKQYRNLSIASGQTLSCSSTREGILIIYCSERCLVAGTISLNSVGGEGGAGGVGPGGTGSAATSYITSYGGSGAGGGGSNGAAGGDGGTTVIGGGGGGGLTTVGTAGQVIGTPNTTGLRIRQDKRDFTVVSWGAGGGGGGASAAGNTGGAGGHGGGGLILIAQELTITGTISANGEAGSAPAAGATGAGGGGGGGFIYLITRNLIETGTIVASGGIGGVGIPTGADGGVGGAGTIIRERYP